MQRKHGIEANSDVSIIDGRSVLVTVRAMKESDYQKVRDVWVNTKGFKIRLIDDGQERICRFLRRNPGLSCVAVADGKIVGSILCGHDGREGSFYHVCVREENRQRGIGEEMVNYCLAKLEGEEISRVSLIAFTQNEVGNQFWKKLGWNIRKDSNGYDYMINDDNIARTV